MRPPKYEMILNSQSLFPLEKKGLSLPLFMHTSPDDKFENLQSLLLLGVTADLNFTLRKGVSGLFRVHIVLRDNGRDELPPQTSSQLVLDPSSISQSGISGEKILVMQVDAENQPPTFITDRKLEVLQAQVCLRR